MLLWILIGLVIAISVGVAAYNWYWESFSWGLVAFLFSLVLSAIGGFVVLAVVACFPVTHVVDEWETEHDLQALATGSETNGRFYLLGGYLGEDPEFRYLLAEGDGYVLRSIPADNVVVYEGDYAPRLEVLTYEYGNPWLWPWTTQASAYAFYVPNGSISNNIEVTP